MSNLRQLFRRPEFIWWFACGLLAIVIVLLLAKRLYA